nr:glycosyltransferase [Thiorhodococcus mannitoliphagus]
MRYGPPPPPPKCRAPTGSPSRRSGGVNLVIPVYRGHELAARCIDSVLTSKAANSTAFRLVLVNDCSPEPEIKPWLRAVAHNAQGVYLQTQRNLGFIGAINFAMDVCRGRDMVWLNSDTIVYGDWLDRLSAAAWSDPDVATATPLSNNAQLFSYPQPMTANPFPNAQKTALLHRLAALANDRAYEEVPTAIGFCMYLKAEALSAAGRLDDRAYLLGYAEEIDYCFRLASAGWRHLCATDVFVAHKGGASFQLDKARLSKDNDLVIQERYPAQRLEAGVFQRRDPLFKARARLERLWLADNLDWDGLFLLSERAANRYFTYDLLLRRQRSGCRDLQVRHIESRHGPSVRLEGALETPPHNLSFQLPEQRAELVQTLLSLNLSETTTILHDRACPALFLDILASKSEAFDLICLDDSLEDNAYLRAPLPVNHVRRAHSRYRIARWLRSSGHRGTAPNQTQLLPLDTRIDNLWAPIEAPEGPAWVAVWSQEISASEQQRLIELVRIRQTTIRWLLVGQVYDEAAFLSTGQCECLSNPSPSTLLQHLAWIGCRCILHPSRSPGPDPSAFLASRRLMIPYVGIRAADGLAYLTEPMTYGVAINASSEALLSVIAEALTEGTEQGP